MKQDDYCVLIKNPIYFSPYIDRCIKIVIPILLITVYMVYWYLILPYSVFLTIGGLMLAYLIPPAGKESIIPIGIELGIPWWIITISVAFLDVVTALFIVWNFDLIQRIPVVGRVISIVVHQGYDFLQKHRWVDRLYIIGLALFVMIPLQGTGGIGGAIIGNMLGMNKKEIILSVATGAFIGSFLIGISMHTLHSRAGKDFWMIIILIAAIIFISIIGSLIYRFICVRRASKTIQS